MFFHTCIHTQLCYKYESDLVFVPCFCLEELDGGIDVSTHLSHVAHFFIYCTVRINFQHSYKFISNVIKGT